MKVWRLIAHHEDPDGAVEDMKQRNRIAIGWSRIGDLRNAGVSGPSEIASLIAVAHHPIENSHLGGPSLWNLYQNMEEGDLVIVNAKGKRVCVFEIIGPYIYETGTKQIKGYGHQRPACLTSIKPDDLWNGAGSSILKGQNIRWTLVACSASSTAKEAIYKEGLRYSVTSTAIERSPVARQKCIEHFGCKCFVCGLEFLKRYGEIGKDFIHIHHRVDISTRPNEYYIDPKKDLVPLCPNCHAMAHQRRPSIPVEQLRMIYEQHNP
jgi:hypothetical protein